MSSARINLPLPTLGGKQLWGDVFAGRGFRIQQNVITGHHRLLGPRDVRHAWGSFEECHEAWLRLRERHGRAPQERLVVLLHGIFRSKDALRPMARAIEAAGFEAVAVNYPSTRRGIHEHAAQVEQLLDRVEEAREVSFVTHSMGGLVARALLGRRGAWKRRLDVNRLVMIATPNRGAQLVELLAPLAMFRLLAGPAGVELGAETVAGIPLPGCPFGVVAGARGDGVGYNPLLQGDDDMTVSLRSCMLDGAEDTLVVDAVHTFIAQHPRVVRGTVRYLQTGRFGG